MYTVNEVPLDNGTFGWTMMRASAVLNSMTKGLTNTAVPGRHGVIAGIPSFAGAPSITIVVRTPGENLEALYSLFTQNGGVGVFRLTADTGRAAAFELASIDSNGFTPSDTLVDVTINVRFPSASWRDTTRTVVGPTTVTTPVQSLSMFPGITFDITDADIFIGGNFGNFDLVDPSGAWLKTIKTLGYVSGSGILFVGATGQAFRATTAAPWTPTSDISDYIDVSGGGGFRITPTWTTDPSATIAKLSLTTTNQSGVTFSVRAYNSYVLRNGEF